MAAAHTCSRCGTEVQGETLDGLCPQCLLSEGLDLENAGVPAPAAAATVPGVSPSVLGMSRFGDYELLEVIAHGGMGMVYKARQLSLNRLVALKMLLFGAHSSPAAIQRFRAEAAAAASLHHPNIVAIHEVGFCEGQHFLAMDYVAGRPLSALIAGKPLPPRRAAAYLRMIADAIHHAHEHGILHRDLKPSNILIDQEDQPRITDFGLAKRLESESNLTVSGQVLGSPNYMSPEQAGGKRSALTRRSDIYSLGAMLYELLAGRPPFIGEGLADIVPQVLNADPLPPRALNSSVPLDLQTVCLKCLEKEPEKRYPTALALAEELGRFLEGKPVLARPVGRFGKGWRWCRRKPMVAGLAAAVVLVFLLGFAGVTWQARRASRARDLAESRLYATQMKLAHAEIREGKTGGALAMLRALEPQPGERDFRGFDWRYLYGLCLDSPSEILATNAAGFQSVDFSPDDLTIAVGTREGQVELFEFSSHRMQRSWQAHAGAVDHLAFYPRNNSWLATVSSDDGAFKLWDARNERLLFSMRIARGQVADFAFSRSGSFLVTQDTNSSSLNLWQFHEGPLGVTLKTNLACFGPAVFSPDERLLSLSEGNRVALYDLVDGRLSRLPSAHIDMIYAVAFSPDGTTLATGGADERIVLWDVNRRSTIWKKRVNYCFATSLVFSPSGRRLFASGYDQNIRCWNVEHPDQVQLWRGHSARINRLTVARDGRSITSASDDGSVRIWPLETPDTAPASPPSQPFITLFSPRDMPLLNQELVNVYGIAVSSDQERVAATEHRRLFMCDPRTGTVVAGVNASEIFPIQDELEAFMALTFSPDGRHLAVGSCMGKVAFLDAVTLRPLRPPVPIHSQQITHIAYALNGRVLITGGGFGDGIKVTDVANGRILAEFRAFEGTFPQQPLSISSDGKRLATGSPEGRVCIRDIASRRIVACSPVRPREIGDLAFSPDGKWLAIPEVRGPIFLWEVQRPGRWKKLVGHTGAAVRVAFSSDSRTLASGGMDHTIRLWHPDIDQDVAVLTGHSEWIWALAFADHDHALLSGGRDGTLRLWRALSFQDIRQQQF